METKVTEIPVRAAKLYERTRTWFNRIASSIPKTSSILTSVRHMDYAFLRYCPPHFYDVDPLEEGKLLRLATKSRLIATNQNKLSTRALPEAYKLSGFMLQYVTPETLAVTLGDYFPTLFGEALSAFLIVGRTAFT